VARLFVLSGPQVGKSFRVRAGDAVGRTSETPITLKHGSVSRRHAHFECEDGRWSLLDDGSTNGILFQKARVQRIDLVDGCEFQLGELSLRFRDHEPEFEPVPVLDLEREPMLDLEREPVLDLEREPMLDLEREALLDAPRAAPMEVDEIELEAADEPARQPTRVERRNAPSPSSGEPEIVLRRATSASAPAAADVFGHAPAGAGATISRNKERAGERVLQYSKVDARSGLANAELSQLGGWTKFLIALAALAVMAGLAWIAYSGAAWFKRRASDRAASDLESESTLDVDDER